MTDDFEDKDEVPEFDEEPSTEAPDDVPSDAQPDSALDSMGEITDDDKLWALLAYVLTPLVPIIILMMSEKKERPFIQAHNMQALIWGIILVVVGLLSSFLCGIPALLLWLVGCYWGYQAYQGELVTIPVITGMVSK